MHRTAPSHGGECCVRYKGRDHIPASRSLTVPEWLMNMRRLADGTVAIEIRGEIDVAHADQLRTTLVDTVTNVRPVRIVVDLLHVTFVDSSGIGALAAGQNAARSVGIGFVVTNPATFVRQQLRMMGLTDAFGVQG
jgi:anti-anti-sigma factor